MVTGVHCPVPSREGITTSSCLLAYLLTFNCSVLCHVFMLLVVKLAVRWYTKWRHLLLPVWDKSRELSAEVECLCAVCYVRWPAINRCWLQWQGYICFSPDDANLT